MELFDLVVELGLDGLHIDDGVLENLEPSFVKEVGASAKEKNLYLEYNMSMDLGNIDTGIQHDLKEGLNTALDLGADVIKVGMDLARPKPRTGSEFDPRVMPYFKETIKRFKAVAPMAEEYNIRFALENHCDSFSKEILWILKEVDHPFVGRMY